MKKLFGLLIVAVVVFGGIGVYFAMQEKEETVIPYGDDGLDGDAGAGNENEEDKPGERKEEEPRTAIPATHRGVVTDYFRVVLPQGWVYEPRQGVDSFVGTFRKGDVALNFDYGLYGSTGLQDSDPHTKTREMVGGRCVSIYVPKAGGVGTMAMQSEDRALPCDFDGVTTMELRSFLVIKGDNIPESLRAEVLGIFRSFEFEN